MFHDAAHYSAIDFSRNTFRRPAPYLQHGGVPTVLRGERRQSFRGRAALWRAAVESGVARRSEDGEQSRALPRSEQESPRDGVL